MNSFKCFNFPSHSVSIVTFMASTPFFFSEKPGVPQILKIIPLADKVIVQWSVPKDGGSKILAYVIEYKNETQKEWLSREIRPANIDRYQIMDLKPHTLYSFRLYAKNAVGRGAFSKQHTYLTTGTASKDASPGTARPSGRGISDFHYRFESSLILLPTGGFRLNNCSARQVFRIQALETVTINICFNQK